MRETQPKCDAFFANATQWPAELRALRAVLHDCPLTEEFKYRSPCYTVQGGNVATVWGLKDACVLAFFKGVLLEDPAGILVAPGENSRSVRMIRLTSVAQIAGMDAVLKHYIHRAITVETAGLKVDFPKDDLAWPEELISFLETHPDVQLAFDALTPGRQRGYILHFAAPSQSKTKAARIEKAMPRILDGKGMNDR